MKSLTERRIYSKAQGLERMMETFYEKVFPVRAADDEFFRAEQEFEDELTKKLARRPITALQIAGACNTFTKKYRAACLAAKKRVEQARKSAARDRPEAGGTSGS